ncbi:hypothetical protein [Enterococcus sp. AZ101]|uniref:hypothetical protein n=1 Tax=Enterococcus sp. AZ101 TaxID=2774742 RepID=UPI003D281AB1
MEVFLSWSKKPSQQYAEVFHKFLPIALQHVNTFMSTHSIEKGDNGTSKIFDTLSETGVGILFLTPNNIQESWLNFEAGALYKGVRKNRVMPLLFDGDKDLLKGPITNLQAGVYNKEEVFSIFEVINNMSSSEKIDPERLKSSFDLIWPKIEKEVMDVSKNTEYSNEELEVDNTELKFQQILDELQKLKSNNSKSFEVQKFSEEDSRQLYKVCEEFFSNHEPTDPKIDSIIIDVVNNKFKKAKLNDKLSVYNIMKFYQYNVYSKELEPSENTSGIIE